ncbi:MAG: type II toxin-antitoxin system prevent-host-death family antitoxin [Chloroflexi bacterium]|nr:type II toxin-antitoxin system prevent-host-death family antitoxin [Chloroflexota bacterium]
MEKTVGAFEARRSLGKLIEEAYYKKDAIIIERSGRPMAVIVSIEDYQTWQRLAKEQVFTLLETAQRRSQDAPVAKVERDVRAALADLRREKRPRKRSGA